tara:strand:+ start:9650 stop:9997 length:348 start_codon:yes stop_codon:yes gene_type:complete
LHKPLNLIAFSARRNSNFDDMKVDADLVKNVATLAQLQIQDSDLEKTITNLTDVLGLVDQMQGVDTREISPMSNPLDATQVMRPDVITESNQRDQFQKVSPNVEKGFFLVPRVVD